MTTFMMTMKFTDQGIRTIKDAPKRMQAARDLADIHAYLQSVPKPADPNNIPLLK